MRSAAFVRTRPGGFVPLRRVGGFVRAALAGGRLGDEARGLAPPVELSSRSRKAREPGNRRAGAAVDLSWQQQFRPIFFEQSPADMPADASREPDSNARAAARAIQASRR